MYNIYIYKKSNVLLISLNDNDLTQESIIEQIVHFNIFEIFYLEFSI